MSVVDDQRLAYQPLAAEFLDRIMEIELEAYPEPWSRGMFLEEIRSQRSYFCVARRAGELIGYGGYWLVLDEAHVTSVTIDKRYRGSGYGRDLMLHLMETALEQGVRQASLEVRGTNTPARNLYLSLGFTDVGLRKGYYSSTQEDAIVMMKDFES